VKAEAIKTCFHGLLVAIALHASGGADAGELHEAAKAGDVEAVQALVDGGAEVEAWDFTGTALHMAAIKGHAEDVEVLIAGGADIEAQADMKDARPLHLPAIPPVGRR
jgi:cytochrome c